MPLGDDLDVPTPWDKEIGMEEETIFDFERYVELRAAGETVWSSGFNMRDREIVGVYWVVGAQPPMLAIISKKPGAK